MCFKPRKQKDNSSFHSAAAQSDCESAAECRLHGDCNIMSHPGFGHLWKQAELADLDIVISISSGTETEAAGSSAAEELKQQTVLQRLPGHSQIISVSPFFGAQVTMHAIMCSSASTLPAGCSCFRPTRTAQHPNQLTAARCSLLAGAALVSQATTGQRQWYSQQR